MASNGQIHFVRTFLLIVSIWLGTVHSQKLPDSSLLETHEKWISKYRKVYKDISEKQKRFEIFKKNVHFIESFNSNGTKTYKLSINQFADQTNEEFKAIRNGFKRSYSGSPKSSVSLFRYQNVTDLPNSMDWTQKEAVTPIKDQGNCGSCWAFSAIAAIEGIHQLTTGQLVSLSEQVLVDCDNQGNNHGCEGGLMDDGFEFIIKNEGITTEENYPYTASNGKCDTNKLASRDVQIKGYEGVPSNSELDLIKAVANQPVSVAIDAGSDSFRFYSSGIFDGECGTNLNHGVTIVGYSKTDDGTGYWLVKNSWGTNWGEGGYIRMKRNIINIKEGLCGIAMLASYPTA